MKTIKEFRFNNPASTPAEPLPGKVCKVTVLGSLDDAIEELGSSVVYDRLLGWALAHSQWANEMRELKFDDRPETAELNLVDLLRPKAKKTKVAKAKREGMAEMLGQLVRDGLISAEEAEERATAYGINLPTTNAETEAATPA